VKPASIALRFAAAAIICTASQAHPQAYPSKPIRLILPYPPGGSADFVARPVAAAVANQLGQPFIIDNRGGAGGAIAMEITARSAPDGYTIALGMTPQLAANVSLYKNLAYDPVKDFAPITLLVSQPYLLVVHATVPANSVKELVALAKSRPGKLIYWSSGSGGVPHLSMELFAAMTQIELVHVPYKGGGPAYPDFLAGRTQLTFSIVGIAGPHIQAGRIRALAVSSSTRSKAAPDVPTIAEAGVPGYDSTVWYGLLAPRGTPRPIIDRLHRDFTAGLRSEDTAKRYTDNGLDIIASTPEAFASYIKAEIGKWADVVKKSGARID
jgi:tripartite-type tricarboxylate transporter receptor subunit TctC